MNNLIITNVSYSCSTGYFTLTYTGDISQYSLGVVPLLGGTNISLIKVSNGVYKAASSLATDIYLLTLNLEGTLVVSTSCEECTPITAKVKKTACSIELDPLLSQVDEIKEKVSPFMDGGVGIITLSTGYTKGSSNGSQIGSLSSQQRKSAASLGSSNKPSRITLSINSLFVKYRYVPSDNVRKNT